MLPQGGKEEEDGEVRVALKSAGHTPCDKPLLVIVNLSVTPCTQDGCEEWNECGNPLQMGASL